MTSDEILNRLYMASSRKSLRIDSSTLSCTPPIITRMSLQLASKNLIYQSSVGPYNKPTETLLYIVATYSSVVVSSTTNRERKFSSQMPRLTRDVSIYSLPLDSRALSHIKIMAHTSFSQSTCNTSQSTHHHNPWN